MQCQSVMPSRITYNTLISVLDKGIQPEWALEVFQAMQRQGVVPDIVTYSALISACEKGNDATARPGAQHDYSQHPDQCLWGRQAA